MFRKTSVVALTLVLLFSVLRSVRSADSESIVVYWGQASEKTTQNELGYYCESQSFDIIILSFVSAFGERYIDYDEYPDGFELNLSNKCHYDGEHFYCPNVGSDIKKCQKLGKKVLLSFGGEQENKKRQTYGFQDDDEAERFATLIWNSFGEGKGAHRPFGDAIVDGFDIDAENQDQTGYLKFVQKLSELSKTEGIRPYYFSAAPQCNFPDRSMSRLIDGFELDYIFVQFYNNECGLNSKSAFNFDEWADHLLRLGYLKTRLYIGLPSTEKSAGSGYVEDVDVIGDRINDLHEYYINTLYFGGLMFWDAKDGFDSEELDSEDKSYIYKVWKTLGGFEATNSTDIPSGASISNSSSPTTATRTGGGNSIEATSIIGLLPLCLAGFFLF